MDNQPTETQVTTDTPVVNIDIPQQPMSSIETEEVKALNGEIVEKENKYPCNPNGLGTPCKYCAKREEIDNKVKNFVNECYIGKLNNQGNTVRRAAFIEDLCLELDIDEDTATNWYNKHPNSSFFGAIKKIKLIQKSALKKTCWKGKGNIIGSMFLLKADHGLVETEKRILAGENNGTPLKIEITEDNKAQQLLSEISK
jgi:hypothetical protein